jgi:hypothetical protein
MQAIATPRPTTDKYLDLIDQYIKHIPIDPDYVFNNTSFYTVTSFLLKWFRDSQLQDRYNEFEKQINSLNSQK